MIGHGRRGGFDSAPAALVCRPVRHPQPTQRTKIATLAYGRASAVTSHRSARRHGLFWHSSTWGTFGSMQPRPALRLPLHATCRAAIRGGAGHRSRVHLSPRAPIKRQPAGPADGRHGHSGFCRPALAVSFRRDSPNMTPAGPLVPVRPGRWAILASLDAVCCGSPECTA